jgi:hypothetical protein
MPYIPRSGVWNETEAWPLMFKAVDTIQALPDLEEVRVTIHLAS